MGRHDEAGESCERCGAPLRPADEFCVLCATPRSTGDSVPLDLRPSVSRRRFQIGQPSSRRWVAALLTLDAGVLIVLAGVFTGGFGLPLSSFTGRAISAGAEPNPYHEAINAVYAEVNYTGNGSGYFQVAPSGNLCDRCPVLPSREDQSGVSVVTLLVYLNLTNSGSGFHALENFSVMTRDYSGTSPFSIRAVLCCGPSYLEPAAQAWLGPGETLALAVVLEAPSVPSNGGAGFVLVFGAESQY